MTFWETVLKHKIDWNIANILTMFRIFLVPVILILIGIYTPLSLIIAFILFLISSVTDILDGHLARKLSLQSEFGAYWDPLADKILTLGVFTVLIFFPEYHIYWWLVLPLYLRDIGVTLIRNYFSRHEYKFTTSIIAKTKTVFQMVNLGVILAFMMITRIIAFRSGQTQSPVTEIWGSIGIQHPLLFSYIPFILTLITVILTIYSSLKYIVEYAGLIRQGKKNGK